MSQPYDQPLFGDPGPPRPRREMTKKEADDAANKIVWTRYRVANTQCTDCVVEYPLGQRTSIGAGAWLRVQGDDKRVLCLHHRGEYLHREQLEALRGGK